MQAQLEALIIVAELEIELRLTTAQETLQNCKNYNMRSTTQRSLLSVVPIIARYINILTEEQSFF